MKRETLVIRPEKHKRRIGVLPTYVQMDRTKYSRKAKHRGQNDRHGCSLQGVAPGKGGSVDTLCMRGSTQTSSPD